MSTLFFYINHCFFLAFSLPFLHPSSSYCWGTRKSEKTILNYKNCHREEYLPTVKYCGFKKEREKGGGGFDAVEMHKVLGAANKAGEILKLKH